MWRNSEIEHTHSKKKPHYNLFISFLNCTCKCVRVDSCTKMESSKNFYTKRLHKMHKNTPIILLMVQRKIGLQFINLVLHKKYGWKTEKTWVNSITNQFLIVFLLFFQNYHFIKQTTTTDSKCQWKKWLSDDQITAELKCENEEKGHSSRVEFWMAWSEKILNQWPLIVLNK